MAKITNWKEQREYWDKKRKDVAKKYQEKRKLLYLVNKGAAKKRKETAIILSVVNKRAPIRKVSKKEAARKRKYLTLIKELSVLPEHQECAAKFEGCTFIPTEWHHGVGRIGKRLLNKKYLKHLCHPCHVVAELNPDRAKEVGISFLRLAQN